MNPKISIIIPMLNEADSIAETLDAILFFDEQTEIIVVDGGSSDATVSIVQNYDAKILHSPERGRGRQLQIGGTAANGEILWFLHADTLPPVGAIEEIKKALTDSDVVGGNFTIRFDGDSRAAQFLTWLYPKLNMLGLIYGDSAIFVRREIYERVGGFKAFPIFEDLDFIERMRKTGEIVTLPQVVTTSSRRFDGKSFVLTFARWSFLQILYWCGVPPETLLKFYFPIGKTK